MGYPGQGTENKAVATERSRIENDVEAVKRMKDRMEDTTQRIIRHARSMGYYEPTPEAKIQAPAAVITTMSDALRELDRAINSCSDSLNVFD